MIIFILHGIVQILDHHFLLQLGIIDENQMADAVQFLHFQILALFPLVIIFLGPGGAFEACALDCVECI